MKQNYCNNCIFFKTLGSSYTRVCYLFKDKVSSVSPACKEFKLERQTTKQSKNTLNK